MAKRPGFAPVRTRTTAADDPAGVAARYPSAVPPEPPREDVLVSIKIPARVRDEARRRAFDDNITLRALILRGLAALGLDVSEADQHDRRRRGG